MSAEEFAVTLARLFPVTFRRQHQQFPVEFSELRHILYVLGESRHHRSRQRVGSLSGLARRLHQQFVIFDAFSHYFETQRYEHAVMFWIGVYDRIITGGQKESVSPI